jgi:hypothetical protein
MCSSLRCVKLDACSKLQWPRSRPTLARRLPATLLYSVGSGALTCALCPFPCKVTTRNEVDEDAWDSDGAHTHTSVVTGSTVRVCLPGAAGWGATARGGWVGAVH